MECSHTSEDVDFEIYPATVVEDFTDREDKDEEMEYLEDSNDEDTTDSSSEEDSGEEQVCYSDLLPDEKINQTSIASKVPSQYFSQDWKDVTKDDTNGPVRSHQYIPTVTNSKNLPSGCNKPIDYFKLFFSEDVVETITHQTNKAAKKLIKVPLSPRSRLHRWKEVSVSEMYLCLGMILNMGLVQQPGIAEYWTDKSHRRIEFFPSMMSRNRFQLLFHTMLQFCEIDEENRVKGDRIQSIIDKLVFTFQKYFTPSRELSADESLIGYKGRVSFKQYIPKKPAKWGLLARTLADSATGYLLNIKMYYGKDDKQPMFGLSKSSYAVVNLVEPYLDKGYHVFCDRLYTSLELAEYLHSRGTYLTGTLSLNRKDIPYIIKEGRKKLVSVRRREILLQTWNAKRMVTTLSTYHRGDQTVMKKKRKRSEFVEKPIIIDAYNQNMGGVDLSDQYTSYYRFARRSVKWWKKLFFWLLEVSVTNSYILYRLTLPEKEKKKLSLFRFRDMLVDSLAPQSAIEPKRRAKRLISLHYNPVVNSFHCQRKLVGRGKQCNYCSRKQEGGKRRESSFYCATCPGKPALHPGDCFTNYHIEHMNSV